MEPLFKATIYELIDATEFQLKRLKLSAETRLKGALSLIKEIVANAVTVDDLKEINKISGIATPDCQIEQYEEDLEYFKACLDWSQPVILNKTEWRHYFQGCVRPELC